MKLCSIGVSREAARSDENRFATGSVPEESGWSFESWENVKKDYVSLRHLPLICLFPLHCIGPGQGVNVTNDADVTFCKVIAQKIFFK